MEISETNILKELDFNKQLAFAYLTSERLYPNYVHFSNNYNFGKVDSLRKAIDFIGHNIFEINIDKNRIDYFIEKIEDNTPDTENFTTIFVSLALDACTCILDSLDFLIDKDFSRIQTISLYGIDTVNMYIREIENIELSDKDLKEKVNNHPLMINETNIQKGIISYLKNIKSIDTADIDILMKLQINKPLDELD